MPAKKSFPLRVDPDLYEDLRRWAESEFRSVNGQIEYLLREAVRRRSKGEPRTGASGTESEDAAPRVPKPGDSRE